MLFAARVPAGTTLDDKPASVPPFATRDDNTMAPLNESFTLPSFASPTLTEYETLRLL